MPPPKECNPHFVYGTASNENKVIQLMIDLFLMRGKVGLYCYAPFGPDGSEKKVWTKKMSQVFTDTNEVFVEFGDKVTLRDERRQVVYTYSLGAQAVDPDQKQRLLCRRMILSVLTRFSPTC